MLHHRRLLTRLLPLALAFGLGASARIRSLEASDLPKAGKGVDQPALLMGQIGQILTKVEAVYVDPVSRSKLLEGALGGMVGGLDPHSGYMNREEYAQFRDDSGGRFGGIGIEVDVKGDLVTVIAPIEGGPAERMGVKSGDRILAVDTDAASEVPASQLLRKLRGAPGTSVKLLVRREGTPDPLTFTFKREVISVKSVQVMQLDNGVLYIRIKQFQEASHAELLTAVAKVRAEPGAKVGAVLLDLRSNPGGLVDEAANIADEFLSGGSIYSLRNKGQIIEEAAATAGGLFAAEVETPMVVLVNEWSASASELLSGALQDHGRATIVGTLTFGKGSVQTIYDLPNGAGMKITTGRYYTPKGHAIQVDGVHPDLPIVAKKEAGIMTPREGDLRGSLSAEERQRKGSRPPVYVDAKIGDFVVPRTPAKDPSKGTDPVLAAAYAELLSKMKGTRK
jgi:carboxyl-terminal processing protease